MFNKSRVLLAVALALCTLAGSANAITIAARPTFSVNDGILLNSYQAVPFVVNQTFTDVSVWVLGVQYAGGEDPAYLLAGLATNSGTVDEPIFDFATPTDTQQLTAGANDYNWDPVLPGGLLVPNTYYLLIAGCDTSSATFAECGPAATGPVSSALWLTGDGPITGEVWGDGQGWIPESTLGGFLITGNLVGGEVPEPGTWVLLSAGMVTLGLLRRRRKA